MSNIEEVIQLLEGAKHHAHSIHNNSQETENYLTVVQYALNLETIHHFSKCIEDRIQDAIERIKNEGSQQPKPLQPEELEEPNVCPTCDGTGGIDSGGVTPWGSAITIPCPSCNMRPDPNQKEQEQ